MPLLLLPHTSFSLTRNRDRRRREDNRSDAVRLPNHRLAIGLHALPRCAYPPRRRNRSRATGIDRVFPITDELRLAITVAADLLRPRQGYTRVEGELVTLWDPFFPSLALCPSPAPSAAIRRCCMSSRALFRDQIRAVPY